MAATTLGIPCPEVRIAQSFTAAGVRSIAAPPTAARGLASGPLPLIAAILVLATPKGRANSLAFTCE
ncbi:hypothetical protein [Streptomyces sp. NPDC056431]|uniref:hypothetical protein n=1 Tax=Streptomyces sp. NPDC056431 TaxID=3345814 RepID=UPI0036BB0AF7